MEAAVALSQYEIERGKPMPSFNHSVLQMRLGTLLSIHYNDQYELLSEVDLDLPNAKKPTVPDLSITPKRKVDWLNDVLQVKEPPLTVIEILSPMQNIESVKNKIFENYFAAGVKSAWLVVPSLQTISVYTPDSKIATFSSGAVHDPVIGVTLQLEDIFY